MPICLLVTCSLPTCGHITPLCPPYPFQYCFQEPKHWVSGLCSNKSGLPVLTPLSQGTLVGPHWSLCDQAASMAAMLPRALLSLAWRLSNLVPATPVLSSSNSFSFLMSLSQVQGFWVIIYRGETSPQASVGCLWLFPLDAAVFFPGCLVTKCCPGLCDFKAVSCCP